jgi:PAS domain-containing protein
MTQTKSEGDDLLRRIANATPALIAHVDRDQRFVFVNFAYAEQFSRTPAEVVG